MKSTKHLKASALLAIAVCIVMVPVYAQSSSDSSSVGFNMSSIMGATPAAPRGAALHHQISPGTVRDVSGKTYYGAGSIYHDGSGKTYIKTGNVLRQIGGTPTASPHNIGGIGGIEHGPTIAHDMRGNMYTSSAGGHIYHDMRGDTYVRTGNMLHAVGGPMMMHRHHH